MKSRKIVYTVATVAVAFVLIGVGHIAVNLVISEKVVTGSVLFAMAVCSPILFWGRSRPTPEKESDES